MPSLTDRNLLGARSQTSARTAVAVPRRLPESGLRGDGEGHRPVAVHRQCSAGAGGDQRHAGTDGAGYGCRPDDAVAGRGGAAWVEARPLGRLDPVRGRRGRAAPERATGFPHYRWNGTASAGDLGLEPVGRIAAGDDRGDGRVAGAGPAGRLRPGYRRSGAAAHAIRRKRVQRPVSAVDGALSLGGGAAGLS